MNKAYLIGAFSTRFAKRPDDSVKTLTREVLAGVLHDAGDLDSAALESCWFGNCGMWLDGQGSIRGQVALSSLVSEGLFPERVPVTNVEGGCASGSLALNGAWKDVLAGVADISIAIGVEKTFWR